MFEGLTAQRLLGLFALGWLLLNFPLLGLWDRDLVLGGIPLLPAALFIGWAVLIGLLAWISERGELNDDPKTPAASALQATPGLRPGPSPGTSSPQDCIVSGLSPEGNSVGLGRPGAD